MTPSAGTVLSGCYALTDRITAGGRGEFWATDTVLGRTDAVTAKLTGLGISALVNTAAQAATDQTFATAPHRWPVQVTGQSATTSNDIYALGMVGDEMLTRQPPFIADSLLATGVAQLNMTPPPRTETVPVGIRNAIGAALARDPAKGSAAAADMARGPGMADAVVVSGARVVSPVAAFSLADIGGARTPGVTATTAAPPNQNRARQATTTEIASPSKDSHMPGQPTMSQAAAMDHHQKKDGKQ